MPGGGLAFRTAGAARPRDVTLRPSNELFYDYYNANAGDRQYRKFRQAQDGGWFSFRMKVAPDGPVELLCTYWGDEGGKRTFALLVDGRLIATEALGRIKPGAFFDKSYAIPRELTGGKQTVEVRFRPRPGNSAGPLFGARTLRGSQTQVR